MAGQDSPRYAPISEGARYAHVHPQTIRRMVARGDLTGYRLGRRILRVNLNELDALLRKSPNAKTVA